MKKKVFIIFLCLIMLTGCNENIIHQENEETEWESKEEMYEEETGTVEEEKSSENTQFLSEEQYKEMCIEVFYDEIFFSKADLQGHDVKIHVFLSEECFFELDAIYDYTLSDMIENYNLYRTLYKGCILRRGTDSYAGEQINILFSQDYGYDPNNYEEGQKLVMYGEVVEYSTNTWDGYNDVSFIPRYIEFEE